MRAPFFKFKPDDFQFGVMIGLAFRYFSGQNDWINRELIMPLSEEKLVIVRKGLGVKYYKAPLSELAYPPHRVEYKKEGEHKVVVEMVTQRGTELYARIIVFVVLGVGCTMWWAFAPYGGGDLGPGFRAIEGSYEQFLNMSHTVEGFKRMSFCEESNTGDNATRILERVFPFTEVKIPAQGPALQAVGIAIILGILLTMGALPECT